MNKIEIVSNGEPVTFTEQSIVIANNELFYSDISDIFHKGGQRPAFAFTYDNKRVELPYDPKDKEIIVSIFRQVLEMKKGGKAPVVTLPQETNPQKGVAWESASPISRSGGRTSRTSRRSFYKRKVVIIPLAIVVLIAAAVGIWALTTEKTKEVAFEKVTFEIPESWNKTTTSSGLLYSPPKEGTSIVADESISVNLIPYIKGKKLKTIAGGQKHYIQEKNDATKPLGVVSRTHFTIDGKKAISLHYEQNLINSRIRVKTEIFVMSKKKVYHFEYDRYDNISDKNYEKIVDSIQFH